MNLAKIFFTALPAVNKHLLKVKIIDEKLDYLYWLRKEMKNMVLEFSRIDENKMFKIAEEKFSSRNKHLDSFINIGIRATKYEGNYDKQNLYNYVSEQVGIREKIVIPQIENEIEYLEKIKGREIPINELKFKELWNRIVDSNFMNDTIINAYDELKLLEKPEFEKFIQSMFSRRSIKEWMKYYEMEDKVGQYERLKEAKLPAEIEYQNSLRITNTKYGESTVGLYTLQNLRSFEEKYVKQIEKIRKGITDEMLKNSSVNKVDELFPQFKDLFKNKITGNGEEGKDKSNYRSLKERIKPFFDDRMIFEQLNKLDENKKLDYINSTLDAIKIFFDNKDFYDLPIHIKLLVKQLEGQKLIYENLEIKQKQEIKKEYPTFNFDFIKIIEFTEKLDDDEGIQYLRKILESAARSDTFENSLEKGVFEQDIRKTIWEQQFKIDINDKFNVSQFKTYDFDDRLILEYAKNIKNISDRIKYYKYILREYKYVISNIEYVLNPKEEKNFQYSETYTAIHREALLYSIYIEEKKGVNFEDTMNKYLLDVERRLKLVEKRVKDELNFTLKLIDKEKSKRKSNISKRTKTKKNNELKNTRKKWLMTKSEFARLVIDTYAKEKHNYKSLKDATNKIFEQYEFEDKKWTKEKCYDLVRKA